MKNSKIIQILSSLSGDEMKRLGDYVRSPYFNTSNTAVKLYDVLKKRYPGFPGKKLDKKIVFGEIHGGSKFNEQVYKNNSSEFLKLLKNFLVQTGLDKDQDTRSKILLNQYNSRYLDNLFDSTLKNYKKFLNSGNNIDENYFDRLFSVEQEIVQHGLSRSRQNEICENVINRCDYQIFHLYIWLLKALSEIRSNEYIFNAVYEPNLPREFFKQIESFDILKHANLLKEFEKSTFEIFYYGVLASYYIENDDYYYRFKELFLKNINKFRFEVGFTFLVRLEASCIHRSQKNRSFSRELFEVYKLKLKLNMYKYRAGSRFSIINFRNMLVVALGLGELAWAEEFVEKYYRELPAEHRQWMYSFSMARICFEKKQYDESFEHLNKIDIKEFAFKFEIRSLLVKLFYEINNIDGLLHEIETYRQFLYKNKNVSEQRKTGCLNFLSYVNELAKIEDKNTLDEFHRKVANTDPVNDKEWLLRKSGPVI